MHREWCRGLRQREPIKSHLWPRARPSTLLHPRHERCILYPFLFREAFCFSPLSSSARTTVSRSAVRLNEYIISCCEEYHLHGFFNKRQVAVGSLEPMLNALAVGGRYFPPEYVGAREAWVENGHGISGRLSEREIQVLHLIAHGHSDDEIGRKLEIHLSTAATHKSAILRKLGQPSIAKLTHYAIAHGYGRLSY